MSLDKFLGKQFHQRDYNCLHFTRDVWAALTGVDITELLAGVLTEPRVVSREVFNRFTRLEKPEDPCLVFMSRPHWTPHVGVYVHGKVLHLHPLGVEFQPLDVSARFFTSVRYYRP